MHGPIISTVEATRLLGGEAHGRNVLARGPGHSRNDRSLSVLLARDSPNGFTVHSFASDDPRECRAYVCTRLGLSERQLGKLELRPIYQSFRSKTLQFRPELKQPVRWAAQNSSRPIFASPGRSGKASANLKNEAAMLRLSVQDLVVQLVEEVALQGLVGSVLGKSDG